MFIKLTIENKTFSYAAPQGTAVTAHMAPWACEVCFIHLPSQVVTEFLYRVFNNDVKCGFLH